MLSSVRNCQILSQGTCTILPSCCLIFQQSLSVCTLSLLLRQENWDPTMSSKLPEVTQQSENNAGIQLWGDRALKPVISLLHLTAYWATQHSARTGASNGSCACTVSPALGVNVSVNWKPGTGEVVSVYLPLKEGLSLSPSPTVPGRGWKSLTESMT